MFTRLALCIFFALGISTAFAQQHDLGVFEIERIELANHFQGKLGDKICETLTLQRGRSIYKVQLPCERKRFGQGLRMFKLGEQVRVTGILDKNRILTDRDHVVPVNKE